LKNILPLMLRSYPLGTPWATFISTKKGTLPKSSQNTSILPHFMPFYAHLVFEFALLGSL